MISVLALSVLVSSFGIAAGNGLWAIHRPEANFAGDVATLLVTAAALRRSCTRWACWAPPAVPAYGGTTGGTVVRCYRTAAIAAQLSMSFREAYRLQESSEAGAC